jgi:hypothetical protein
MKSIIKRYGRDKRLGTAVLEGHTTSIFRAEERGQAIISRSRQQKALQNIWLSTLHGITTVFFIITTTRTSDTN